MALNGGFFQGAVYPLDLHLVSHLSETGLNAILGADQFTTQHIINQGFARVMEQLIQCLTQEIVRCHPRNARMQLGKGHLAGTVTSNK